MRETRALADRVGILPEYVDQTGRALRTTSDATRTAILGAMGIEASTEDAARESLEAMETRERATLLEPVRVRLRGGRSAGRLRVRLPGSPGEAVRWRATLTTEEGEPHRVEGTSAPGRRGELVLDLGVGPPEGYHTLEVTLAAGRAEHAASQSLIVVPRTCRRVRPVFGVFANFYTVRGAGDWGVGDLSVLASLLEWTAREGATSSASTRCTRSGTAAGR